MTTTARTTPTFTVRAGSSNLRALLIAALCAFIVTTFLIDVNQAAPAAGAAQVEQRT